MEFFDKTQNIKTVKQKFNYLKKHFIYYTMNSWNGLRSIANNVKAHNLPLTKEQYKRFFDLVCDEELNEQLYSYINNMLQQFRAINKGYKVYFNGRSDGYLVLYNDNNNSSVLNEYIEDASSYEEALNNYKSDYNTTTKEARANIDYCINNDFDIVQAFDRFCDDVLNELIKILDSAAVEEEEEKITVKHKILVF